MPYQLPQPETGPNLSKRDDNNCTPLHVAILNGEATVCVTIKMYI